MYFTAFPTVKSAMRNYKMVTLHFEFSPKQRRLRKRGKMKRVTVQFFKIASYIKNNCTKLEILNDLEKNW